MKKRLLAAVLCLAMLISCVPSFAFRAQASELPVITCNGSAQSAVSFPRNERITLTAEGGAWYQWQIKVNDSLWVNISGETGETLDVSYAMIANLCQGDTAFLRVVADGERKSEPVAVTATEAKIKPSEEPAAAPVILAAPQVVVSNPSTGSSAADSANTEAVAQAQAALTAAEAAANAAAEIAIVAEEDAAAKQAAYYEAQNKADAAKAAMDASAVTTEIPAETSAEDLDENGNPVVVKPAETVVTYDPDLQAAYAAAQAEADAAWQVYSEAAITLADAEANLEAAQAAVETAAAELEAAQNQTTGENPGSANYDLPQNGETKSTYNVVVNYLFENNEIVADPYTANLAAGSNFSATVTFPTVQGYLPYLNEVQQDDLELNFTAIDQDHTYNVVYKPTNVNYTVIHYKQNLNDDNYTEAERETKQGLTNSTVPDVAKKYDGFYALLYEKPAIAADGSTVVEVYYDRYYYLMNFNLDGGYGVEPIYARYGAPIGNVGTPTKAGYRFGGWSLNGSGATTLPDIMPAENRTYTAIWQADATAKVTVVFWGENADDEGYSYIRSMQVDATPGENYTFDGSTLTCPLAEHSHNSCTLACTHTAHTIDCYSTDYGFIQTDKPNNSLTPQENGIYTYKSWGRTYYYLNIGDKWYCGTDWWGDKDATEKITYSCVHTHTDECYDCGKIGHTHGSSCSGLWTFAESETVPVAADGSSTVNVYYDRTEKTLTFKYNYSNRNYQSTETIKAKWGADISEQFKKITANAKSSFWTEDSNGYGPYTNYIGIMPQTDITYYNPGADGETGSMTYWGQDLSGNYTVKLFEVTGVGGYTVTDEDRYEFEGFTYHHGSSNGSDCEGAAFYYTRNSYTLTFNDGYSDVKSDSVLYQAPLSNYSSYVPEVPSAKEPGSVTFGGWYLNPECTGDEYVLDDHTMPADNVLLYAKWVPVNHTVEFYLDANALDKGTKLREDITVSHGSKVEPVPADPENGSYTFVGWFYMEDGVEKAFDFANMPVKKDLKVYGKWSSNVLKQYTILYKVQGTDTQIAAPTTGSGLAGATKTFDAKGGTDLYADYRDGYFPVTKSHSMTLDINATEENDTNVFTFWYVQKNAVPYTVKYLNKVTGEPVADEKTVSDNRKAVVTETFVPVSGMMPDAYQKRLVVSAEEGAVNEIIFYYTEDTTHAYYKITHYTENLGTGSDGKPTWTEYASSQAVGDIGETYTADPMTIPGFTCDETVIGTVKSGKLTADGLELKLYYTRNSYPYQVRYLEQGTAKQLADPKDGTGKYGQVISESAISIPGYTAEAPTSQTLNIKIEEGTEAKLNIITFYYKEIEAIISYRVVGPEGCGTVSLASETLKVLTGAAQGSTAAANTNYRFVGWYKDEACTNPVADGWVTSGKITPQKTKDYDPSDVTLLGYEAATYYAKFEYDLTTLTITKSGAADANDGFIFDVVGSDGTSFTVSVKGNGSVTIAGVKVGTTYTITERASWSWRYAAAPGEITLDADSTKNEVTITNSVKNQYLLDGSAYARNNSVLSNTAE